MDSMGEKFREGGARTVCFYSKALWLQLEDFKAGGWITWQLIHLNSGICGLRPQLWMWPETCLWLLFVAWGSSQHGIWVPKASVGNLTEPAGSYMAFYDLASEVTQCHFPWNPFVPNFEGKRNGCQLLGEKLQSSEGAHGTKNIALLIFGKCNCHICISLERK